MSSKFSNMAFQLLEKIPASATTGDQFSISNDIERDLPVTLTDGASVLLTPLSGGVVIERMKVTATGGKITLVLRGLDQSTSPVEVPALMREWKPGTIIKVVYNAEDVIEKDGDNTFTEDNYFSKSIREPNYADATARDAAITAPLNGMRIYNIALGLFQKYQAGAWIDDDSGGSVPNAANGVAGKVEESTSAQSKLGTKTGSSGAKLIVTPDLIAANEQSNTFKYAADAGSDDTYVIALTPALTAYTVGQTITFKANTINTGACTINVNGLGAKSIKLRDGSDPIDGDIAASELVDIKYDGTNFILQKEVTSSTGRKGTAERSTDAEAIARTDTERYITPSQVKLGYDGANYDYIQCVSLISTNSTNTNMTVAPIGSGATITSTNTNASSNIKLTAKPGTTSTATQMIFNDISLLNIEFLGKVTSGTGFVVGLQDGTAASRYTKVTTTRKVCFTVKDASNLNFRAADGTTETTSADIVQTATTMAKYNIIYDKANAKAQLYIGDVLKSEITTNLPTGTAANPVELCIGTAANTESFFLDYLKIKIKYA